MATPVKLGTLRWLWRHSGLKARWTDHRFRRLKHEWHALGRTTPEPDAAPPNRSQVRVLLIPPDPLLLTASRGDEAMITALTLMCRETFDDPQFVIATASDEADQIARLLGCEPCRAFDEGLPLSESVSRVCAANVTHCVTVGADVFDGSYDPVFSARLLMLTDLLGQKDIRSIVNGFSFSTRPYPGLAPVFEQASKHVVFNLRDPVSHRRFCKFSNAPATLTADVAFLLKTDTDSSHEVRQLGRWVAAERSSGRVVIGVNLHPLLIDLDERHKLPALIAEFDAALQSLIRDQPISVVLLEHDFRGRSADSHCLDSIEATLQSAGLGNFVYRAAHPMNAVELKTAVACLDGVATGRMHLAIATLGVGVPVLVFGYKGKMEGLLEHFSLDSRLCISGRSLFDRQALVSGLQFFVAGLDAMNRQVKLQLPKVVKLSRDNLAPFRVAR